MRFRPRRAQAGSAVLDRRLDIPARRRLRLPRLPTAARWLAATALLTVAAVLVTVPARPTAVPTGRLLVAAHDLAPGVPLASRDVRVVREPLSAIPVGALTEQTAVRGRVLTAPARRGEPITDVRLLGTALITASAGPGAVAAPVRVADAGTVALVQPGDRVDVLAVPTEDAGATDGMPAETGSDSAGVVVVATNVVILTVADSATAATADGSLVEVATTPTVAARLAAAAVHARLSLTLHGR